jgi:SAM-dependent methyltransferase
MSTRELYADVRSYDIAFGSDRDFVKECNFLEYCLKKFGSSGVWRSGGLEPDPQFQTSHSGTPPVSFLELAAGPARHAREFARRGWRSVALDLSSDMLKYAQQGAIAEGVKIETVCAGMTDFTLEHPVTLAANLLESLSHLTTNEQVVDHLRAVSRNLLPGGIFVIQSTHPRYFWHDSLGDAWTSKDDDGTEIDVLFGSKGDPYDWISQQWTVTVRLDIREPARPPRVVETHSNFRWYLPQELRALIDLSQAFSRTLWFGSMVVPPPPLDSRPESDEMIVVLCK